MPKTTPTPRVPTLPPTDCTEPSTSIVNASESEEAIPPAEIEEKAPAIARHVLSSNMGLTIVGDPSFEVWEEIVSTYGHVYDKSAWWVGDAIAYGESKFGEKYAQAIKITGRKLGTLQNIVSVCQRVQISRRREKLSFKHHALIAGLHYQTGDELLIRAERERWNTDDMEKEVKRIRALESGVAPETTPKPGSTVAKVAASGKEPQVPEGEKPLIWNGYPLRVMLMPNSPRSRAILQGDEFLTTEESDRAAHQHKFAHGPALAAWLEEHNFIKGGDEPCAQNTIKDASRPAAKDSATDASAPIVSASNGAAPNATESAPTPQPCPECGIVSGHKILCKTGNDKATDYQSNLPNAPAAPPASPEPPISDDIAKTMQAVIDGLQLDVKKLRADHEEEKAQMAAIMEEMGAHPASHNTGEKAMMEVKNIWQSIRIERDDARDQLLRYDAHTGAKTPLQRAEESLLAFAAASESVDWEEIGANKLLRQKWLERLLLPCDLVIDRIQGAAIKGKN